MRLPSVCGFAVLVIGLTGCSVLGSDPEGEPLEGTAWQLIALVRGSEVTPVPADHNLSLRFDEDRLLGVRLDCNGCGGTYVTQGRRIQAAVGVCTLVACPRETLVVPFVNALTRADRYDRDGDVLVLSGPMEGLRFRRIELDPDHISLTSCAP